MLKLRKIIFVFSLCLSLAGCNLAQGLVEKIFPGAVKETEIPVGDFVGQWHFIDSKLEEAYVAEQEAKLAATAAAAKAANGAEAASKTPDPAVSKKEDPKAKKAEEKKSSKGKKADKDSEEEAAKETAPVVEVKAKLDKTRLVKIVLLPLDAADDVGIGMLTFKNITQRFYWEAKGNGKDTWNIQFAKDNNVYTKLTYGFDFNGTLRKGSAGYELSGTLQINDDGVEGDYYLETYRYMYPELVAPPADKAEFVLGEELKLNGKYFSDNAADNVLKFTELKSQKQFEVAATDVRVEDSENNILSLMTDKKWAKGDYQLYLLRGGEFKSNSISIKLK